MSVPCARCGCDIQRHANEMDYVDISIDSARKVPNDTESVIYEADGCFLYECKDCSEQILGIECDSFEWSIEDVVFDELVT